MSNMLYACSILYKTKLPMILVFNKTDVKDASFAKEWMTDYDAFQAALAGAWREVTGGAAELRRTVIGKPHHQTYAYAEHVLGAHRAAMLAAQKGKQGVEAAPPLRRVYMVGDNPESDIQGANNYRSRSGDTEWASVLVRTGVWDPRRGGEPRHPPKMIADDVKAAVDWALKQEGWR